MQPSIHDIDEARALGRRFYICRKIDRRWVHQSELLPLDVVTAQVPAGADVAVFMASSNGDLLYWSAAHPQTYNSSVLLLPIENIL